VAWSDIFAFMCARDEGFAKAVVPVPLDAIAAVQRELGIRLPAMYVELLATLGESAASYHPFGPTQDHNFYRLVELLPPQYHPVTEYFKVTRCTFYDIEPEHYFLDLTRAAEDDTPLVRLDFAPTFRRDLVHDLGSTLAEMLTRWAIVDFELSRKPHHATVYAYADTEPEAFRLRDQVLAHLGKLGMKMLLPPQPRVVGVGHRDRAAKVEVEDELVAIELGGPDETSVRRIAEQLVDSLPNASQVDTSQRGQ
jgi:hypothetical protein